MNSSKLVSSFILIESRLKFVEAFDHVGIKIAWSGSGVDEIGTDAATGKTMVRVNPKYFRPTDVDLLLGDAGKAREKFGWAPEITFQVGKSVLLESIRLEW